MLKSIKLVILPLSLLIINCSLFIVMSSCSLTTQTKTGNLTGNVVLNNDTGNSALDPVDYAGVTVALYPLAVLNPVIKEVNTAHPNIGVQINQETEFDHRLQNPVKIATTNAGGSFTISKINKGKYNLVVMKEGWGVHYIYDINIKEGDNTIRKGNSVLRENVIQLYPVVVLDGFIYEPFIFRTDHNYLISNNVTINANVLFMPNSRIWINPTKKITFLAQVCTDSLNEGFSSVSSSDGFYSSTQLQESQLERCDGLYFYDNIDFANDRLQSIIASFSLNGLTVRTSGINIRNLICKNNGIGLQLDQQSNIIIEKSLFSHNDNPNYGGIALTGCNQTIVKQSIFASNIVGLWQHTSSDADVNNCYFHQNQAKDIMNSYETISSIEHCKFEESAIAVETSGRSNTNVSYCDIQAKTGIVNWYQLGWTSSQFSAHNNNMDCSQYCVKTRTITYPEQGFIYFNCENNYWGVNSSSAIEGKIWDRNDEDTNDPYYISYMGIVDYAPFFSAPIPTAGLE